MSELTASTRKATGDGRIGIPMSAGLLGIGIGCVGVAVLVCMFTIDGAIAEVVQRSGSAEYLKDRARGRWLAVVLKLPGEAWFATVCVFVGALIYGRKNRQHGKLAGIAMAAGCALASCNGLIKWIVGRERPFRGSDPTSAQPLEFEPFRGGLMGLFDGKNLSFPSGHASLGMALAMGLALAFPRWKWIFLAAGAVCALERVAENAHYLSEAMAGGLLGSVCAIVAWKLTGEFAAKRAGRQQVLPTSA